MERTSRNSKPQRSEGPIGLLAAWGRYPHAIAEAMREQGHKVCCLAVRRHADPGLEAMVDDFHWIGMAQLGRAIRLFQQHGVQRAVMAGKFHKAELYRPWAWFRYVPDREFLRTFAPHFLGHQGDRKDDTLLGLYVEAFAKRGITIDPPTDYLPSLLAQEGVVVGPSLKDRQMADAKFGWELAREMGRLDVGQSVCVKDRAVLTVEAIEGTDRCIERAGELCPVGRFTVVKVAKPFQDMRFDVPTVGLRTLETMAKAGARSLVIEAGRTILLEPGEFEARAQQLGIQVLALRNDLQQEERAA